jgi:hypothetical protein
MKAHDEVFYPLAGSGAGRRAQSTSAGPGRQSLPPGFVRGFDRARRV